VGTRSQRTRRRCASTGQCCDEGQHGARSLNAKVLLIRFDNFGVKVLIYGTLGIWRRALAKNTTQKGSEFETQIAALYRSAGYDIKQNYSVSGSDFDLLCRKEISPQIEITIAVECKFKSGKEKVGPLDVEKFSNKFKFARDFGITHGVIVCNNGFAPSAHVTAQLAKITLRSLTELEDDLLGFASKFVLSRRKYQASDIFKEYFILQGHNQDAQAVPDIADFIFWALNEPNTRTKRTFILGDFGAGKTTLVNRLNFGLQEEYLKNRTKRIPVVFRLNRLLAENDLGRFIENQLKSELGLDLSYETFVSLLNGGRITLFLDGLDEIESHADEQTKIFNIARISPFFNSKCDLIITSRATMFKSKQEMLAFFHYIERYESASSIYDNALLARFNVHSAVARLRTFIAKNSGQALEAKHLNNSDLITVRPLSRQMVVSVLKSRKIELEQFQSIPIDDIIRELFNVYDLSDLMSRPFLLFMVIDVLRLHKIKEIIDQKTISSAILYSIYIESYLKRDWEKGKGRQFLTPSERRAFSQCMALSMLYKDGPLAVTFRDIIPVLNRIMNERMTAERRREIESNIQRLVSDVLLCAFLRLSGEDMFEFAHKSFMEYFCAEYIVTALLERSSNDQIAELNYVLNREVLQFIGGLSTAFAGLTNRLTSQLSFTSKSGATTYRNNLAAALLYSNQHSGININRAVVSDCEFRRKAFVRSSFDDIVFQNCSFSQVEFSNSSFAKTNFVNLQANELKFQKCKLVSSEIKEIAGDINIAETICENVAILSLENSRWQAVLFSHGEIFNSKVILQSEVSISQSKVTQSTILLTEHSSTGGSLKSTAIENSAITQLGEKPFVERMVPQLCLMNCNLNHVTFAYPVLAFDHVSLENLADSSGVLLVSVSGLSDAARASSPMQPTPETINPTLSRYFRFYTDRGNSILIVDIDDNESTNVLQRLITVAKARDPVAVVRVLLDNKHWMPVPNDPLSIVKAFCADASSKDDYLGGSIILWEVSRFEYFSGSLASLFTKAAANRQKGEQGTIKLRPGKHSNIVLISAKSERTSSDDATIVVELQGFSSYPEDSILRYEMICDGHDWKINDIRCSVRGSPWSLRESLDGAMND
jgi:uncharacterized protein YjbI with pentapeptide repeats